MKAYRGLLRLVGHALASADHPLLAHLVVTRRCNLACGYCNEYDRVSPPVPAADLEDRVEALARLRTAMIACTGGEPLLHPHLEDVVRAIRHRGMKAMLSTNGYLLTRDRIERLNAAGLQVLQLSIDNLEPDDAAAKSLGRLEDRLRLLARFARFDVNVNTVIGAGNRPADAVEIARRVTESGFSHSVGLAHAPGGDLRTIGPLERSAFRSVGRVSGSALHRFNHLLFQRRLMAGGPCRWKCRAGARFLYVCEHGRVHWCSQRRDRPGIPLQSYGAAELRRAFRTEKSCAPTCTLNCVHHVSALDRWRPQNLPDTWAWTPRT
jgi:MoaA/NifB/PqqE/SkfB family radical SAM enzyme